MHVDIFSAGLGKVIYNLISFVQNVLMAVEKKLANDVMFAMNLPWQDVARVSVCSAMGR